MTFTGMLVLVGYIVIGGVVAVTIERRTNHLVSREGGTIMVGFMVACWPVSLFLVLLYGIGLVVTRITKASS